MSKPLWYHLFYSSNETVKDVLNNRTIEKHEPKDPKNFAYSEDLGFSYNEFLINNFPPEPLVKSLGYIEPDPPIQLTLEEEWNMYLEQKRLEVDEEDYEYDDLEDRFPIEEEVVDSGSSSDEYEDDGWNSV